ncbi:hypothetical protein RHSIM_Rhsim05G0160700 [Rhododendron simsii]|uniref:Uncharacterized protein n=1 Tax=Rhododendron simsii TaxID=118357 RepID=A0A834H019_RHOSS|nr:hypothetical protein RHSIM_Rhsim05G0160700 [Rhododendron simsii]
MKGEKHGDIGGEVPCSSLAVEIPFYAPERWTKYTFNTPTKIAIEEVHSLSLAEMEVAKSAYSRTQVQLCEVTVDDGAMDYLTLHWQELRQMESCICIVGGYVKVISSVHLLEFMVASLTAERDGENRKVAFNTLATGYKILAVATAIGNLDKEAVVRDGGVADEADRSEVEGGVEA